MPKLSHNLYRIWLFALAIIATIAYRIIIVLNYYDPLWVQIAWYIGTIGFVWYFAHRYRVENKRDKLITDLKLVEKVEREEPLNKDEKASLVYILKALKTSLSKWNYIVIFFLSAIALIYAIYQDITRFLS